MKVSAGILAGIMALSLGHQASAAVLTATVKDFPYTSFTVEFVDGNNDRRLDFNEISSFSGVTSDPGLDTEKSYNTILGIPTFPGFLNAGVSIAVGQSVEDFENRGIWLFDGLSGQGEGIPDFWEYSITGLSDPAVVPLPAGFPLLLAAFGALALLRRRSAVAA